VDHHNPILTQKRPAAKKLVYVTGSDGAEYSAHTRCEDAPCCGCCI
jgi:hypothetical protein